MSNLKIKELKVLLDEKIVLVFNLVQECNDLQTIEEGNAILKFVYDTDKRSKLNIEKAICKLRQIEMKLHAKAEEEAREENDNDKALFYIMDYLEEEAEKQAVEIELNTEIKEVTKKLLEFCSVEKLQKFTNLNVSTKVKVDNLKILKMKLALEEEKEEVANFIYNGHRVQVIKKSTCDYDVIIDGGFYDSDSEAEEVEQIIANFYLKSIDAILFNSVGYWKL